MGNSPSKDAPINTSAVTSATGAGATLLAAAEDDDPSGSSGGGSSGHNPRPYLSDPTRKSGSSRKKLSPTLSELEQESHRGSLRAFARSPVAPKPKPRDTAMEPLMLPEAAQPPSTTQVQAVNIERVSRKPGHKGTPAPLEGATGRGTISLSSSLTSVASSVSTASLTSSVPSADTLSSSPPTPPLHADDRRRQLEAESRARSRSRSRSRSNTRANDKTVNQLSAEDRHGSSSSITTASTATPEKVSSSTRSTKSISEYIKRLIEVDTRSTTLAKSRSFCLTQVEMKEICARASDIFLSQPTLLELGTPVKVVGDIHGQYSDLLRIFRLCGMPPKTNYLFLGDYVDRGKQSLETIMLLLCLKVKYPENVFLLRGNHECASVTKVYGFYDECKRRCSVKLWRTVVDVFNTLPIAATIGGKIFCIHGGLSPYLHSMDDIMNITRPTDVPESGLLSDLLWSDPDPEIYQWSENDRGVSYCFGKTVLDKFCRKFGFDLVARGHMVVEDGYEFFGNRRLVTVFSAPNYCGEFGNWGAVLSVSNDMMCSFELLKPLDAAGNSTKGKKASV